jgi:hypothetical protein
LSFADGWAALNLEMPRRIPRTEYSAGQHWDLIRAVTGIDVGVHSAEELKLRASVAFMREWNFDFFWSTLIGSDEFGALRTDMGHAEYAAGGVDRRDTIFCPFETPEQVLAFDPWDAYGEPDGAELTRRFEEHYRVNCQRHGFGVNMTGIYTTLISGLIEIFGWEMLLLAAGTDPRRFGALADRYAAWMQLYYDALAEADVPVVMVHDDIVWSSGPIFRPSWYREYVFPNYARYFAPLRESGKRIMFTSDGNYDAFVDDIAGCGVHGFVLEPLTSLEAMVERYGKTHVIIGNVDTRILLLGTRDQIRADVERCMSLGRDCPGFFLAVGNHIPPNTPVDNALYYNQVYEELCRR